MARKKGSRKTSEITSEAKKTPTTAAAAVGKVTSTVQKFVGLQAPMYVWHEVHGEACCTALRFAAGSSSQPGAINLLPGCDYEVRYSVDPKKKQWSLQVVQTPATAAVGIRGARRDLAMSPPPLSPPSLPSSTLSPPLLPPPLPPTLPPPPPLPPPLPPPTGVCFCLETGLSRACRIDEIPVCSSNSIDCVLQPAPLAASRSSAVESSVAPQSQGKGKKDKKGKKTEKTRRQKGTRRAGRAKAASSGNERR